MLRKFLWVSAIAIALGVGTAYGQSATPDVRARSFYTWYLHELNANRNPIENSTGLRRYLTTRMANAIRRALNRENGIDADIFVDGQDWDPLWEKNVTASKAVITGTRAAVSVTLKGGEALGTKRLKIGLKKEGGVWKIDSVNGQLSP